MSPLLLFLSYFPYLSFNNWKAIYQVILFWHIIFHYERKYSFPIVFITYSQNHRKHSQSKHVWSHYIYSPSNNIIPSLKIGSAKSILRCFIPCNSHNLPSRDSCLSFSFILHLVFIKHNLSSFLCMHHLNKIFEIEVFIHWQDGSAIALGPTHPKSQGSMDL